MLVKVDGKTYINNITIINNNKKKQKKHLQQNSCTTKNIRQNFGSTCKPATMSKWFRSNKSSGNPVLNH